MRTTLPQPNDERIKSWFALLPVTIGNERRWLEWVTVRQRPAGGTYTYWRNVEFIDYTDEPQTPPGKVDDPAKACGPMSAAPRRTP